MKITPFRLMLTLILIVFFAALWQRVYKEGILKAAYPERYDGLVEKYALQSKLSPQLVFAVIKNESGFQPAAESRIGARGLMQLTPETFQWAQMLSPSDQKYTSGDLVKPEVNIRYGAVVLSSLMVEFGSEDTALAAYHAGRSNVKKWLVDPQYSKDGRSLYYIPFDDTRKYVRQVIETEKMYNKLYNTQQGEDQYDNQQQ